MGLTTLSSKNGVRKAPETVSVLPVPKEIVLPSPKVTTEIAASVLRVRLVLATRVAMSSVPEPASKVKVPVPPAVSRAAEKSCSSVTAEPASAVVSVTASEPLSAGAEGDQAIAEASWLSPKVAM